MSEEERAMATVAAVVGEPVAGSPGFPIIEQAERDVFRKAVGLFVELHRLGVRRRVPASSVETDADVDLLHVAKDILECEELDVVRRYDNSTRRTIIERFALPSPVARGKGFYLLPTGLVPDTDEWLMARLDGRVPLVEAFMAVYERRTVIDEALKRLGTLGNEMDYPPADKVRECFTVKVRYIAFDAPQALAGIKRSIFDRERKAAETQWAEAVEEGKAMLRSNFATMIDEWVERLEPDANGRPKRFAVSSVTRLTDFIDAFVPRNVGDDNELAALVERARGLVKGVDPDIIKSDKAVRERLAAGFATIQQSFDGMIVERPKRRIKLNGDSAPVPDGKAAAAGKDNDQDNR